MTAILFSDCGEHKHLCAADEPAGGEHRNQRFENREQGVGGVAWFHFNIHSKRLRSLETEFDSLAIPPNRVIAGASRTLAKMAVIRLAKGRHGGGTESALGALFLPSSAACHVSRASGRAPPYDTGARRGLFPSAPRATSPAAASVTGLAIMALQDDARVLGALTFMPAMRRKADNLL